MELLIVIMVLALVAALLFGYLGNPLQKTSVQAATTQIVDNLRVLDEAWNQYYATNTAEPSNIDALVNAGVIKSKPEPPSAAKKTGYSGTFAYSPNTADYDIGGSTAKDTVIILAGVTDDVCKRVNYAYAGAAENDDIPTSLQTGKSIQCFKNGNDNIVVKQVLAK